MRLILNIEPGRSGQVRVEVRAVEPEVTLSWVDLNLPVAPNAPMPAISLPLTREVWDAIRREEPS